MNLIICFSKAICAFSFLPLHNCFSFWSIKKKLQDPTLSWALKHFILMSKNRMINLKYMFTGRSLYPKTCKCSLISSLFFIRLTETCFFFRCGETVTKREQFNDLSIDLPRRKKFLPSRSIQDSLDLFFRVWTFRGGFMHCGVCVGYVPYGNSDCTADYLFLWLWFAGMWGNIALFWGLSINSTWKFILQNAVQKLIDVK